MLSTRNSQSADGLRCALQPRGSTRQSPQRVRRNSDSPAISGILPNEGRSGFGIPGSSGPFRPLSQPLVMVGHHRYSPPEESLLNSLIERPDAAFIFFENEAQNPRKSLINRRIASMGLFCPIFVYPIDEKRLNPFGFVFPQPFRLMNLQSATLSDQPPDN